MATVQVQVTAAPKMTQPNSISQPEDEDLLRHAVAGDEGAFLLLYRRRHPGIYRFAQHMSGSAAVAEEVTQEVFLALVRNPEGFKPENGSLLSYMFGVARNQVLRHLARARPYVPLETNERAAESLANSENLLSEMTRNETIESVRQAVLRLPEIYREAVVLCDLQEMAYAEVAEVLGVPVGTVRSRLNRGRALLMDKLRISRTRCLV